MKMKKFKRSIITTCKLLAFIILIEFIPFDFNGILFCHWEGFSVSTYGGVDETALYSLSACLYDAENERVLFSKAGDEVRAMASTTKIMTCIIALEYGNLDDVVEVSKYAASMPNVKLGAKAGEKYVLRDLLYSLMLESHNDAAVIIAEHISGSVSEFAKLMNEKARDLMCYDTYFITPNGLDATETVGGVEKKHSTTAEDLCKIMSYCIKNEMFLEITRTTSYSFCNKKASESGEIVNGGRSFNVSNKNAFLTMMEGALSGKTGFTGEAGYCYVGALKRDGKTFVVALLGCGWPNNKGYKWKDTMYLMEYALNNYNPAIINESLPEIPAITVNNGTYGNKRGQIRIIPKVLHNEIELLTCDEDIIEVKIDITEELLAPLSKGDRLGQITYTVNGEIVGREEIVSEDDVGVYNYEWCLSHILEVLFL